MKQGYMDNAEAMKICRKKKPSGRDVGRLFLYQRCMDILSRHDTEQPVDKEVLDPKVWNKLASMETRLYRVDLEAGIDTEAGETGIYTDHKQAYEYIRTRLQTAMTEFWRALALSEMAKVTAGKLYILLNYKGHENPLFEIITEKEFNEFKYILSEGLEASAYYVNAFNYSLDLISDKYLIDLKGLKVESNEIKASVGYLQDKFRCILQEFNSREQAGTFKQFIYSICDFITKNINNIDYEKITAIPADREEEARMMFKKRLPFFNSSLNKILCVYRKK